MDKLSISSEDHIAYNKSIVSFLRGNVYRLCFFKKINVFCMHLFCCLPLLCDMCISKRVYEYVLARAGKRAIKYSFTIRRLESHQLQPEISNRAFAV